MTPEVAARAFEPFFTTKDVGKGTGLGLSMAYGFAKQSGGSMKIYSELGHGTVIRLFFPRVRAPHVTDAPPVDQIATPTGSETILVVEDDDMVRSYVEKELKELGYRVIVARNGPAALEILREAGKIDLLFTDVVMPGGMFGPELAEEASRLRPALKVLFTSGYSEHPVVSLDRPDQDVRILTKPFRRHDLALMLRSVLRTA
jgi:CheY-like chemotaxis protein